MLMSDAYTIRRLPRDSIIEFSMTTRKGELIPIFKIKANVFPNVHKALPIRPRAASFEHLFQRMYSDLYVVLYNDSGHDQCLALFSLTSIEDKTTSHICRCLGSGRTKKHWKTICEFVNSNLKEILNLSVNDGISMTV